MDLLNWINGAFVEPATGRYLYNVEPATGRVYGRIPDSGPEDVHRAVAAAKAAFPAWSRLTAAERSMCRDASSWIDMSASIH